jgi:hypothetical protein
VAQYGRVALVTKAGVSEGCTTYAQVRSRRKGQPRSRRPGAGWHAVACCLPCWAGCCALFRPRPGSLPAGPPPPPSFSPCIHASCVKRAV